MEKVPGICPVCKATITVNPEKESGFCSKCRAIINNLESIQLYKAHGGATQAPPVYRQPQQTARPKNRSVSPETRVNEMWEFCNSEQDFLMLRSKIQQDMTISDSDKSKMLDILNKKTATRLKETMAKAKDYSESQQSPISTILGCIIIAAIGLAINYFFSKMWPGIIMCALAVIAIIGTLADRNNKSKIEEDKRAAELIQAYRDQGYRLD